MTSFWHWFRLRIDKHLIDKHLSDGEIIAYVDGELSTSHADDTENHLESCWRCRTRREQLERTIFSLVEYRETLLAPFLPPPPLGEDHLLARIERRKEIRKHSWGSWLVAHWGAGKGFKINPTLASALVVGAALVALLLIWQRTEVTVSASELLVRANTWEANNLGNDKPGVIYEEIQINTAGKTFRRTLYRDREGLRKRKAEPVTADLERLKAKLDLAGVIWDEPLSAAAYKNWHDRQKTKTDKVKRSSKNLCTLTTTTVDSVVAQESLTVQETDFHPVMRTIEFRDTESIEIAELNYAALSWNAINDGLFEPVLPSAAAFSPGTVIRNPLPGPPLAELADAEVEARHALHRVGADLGEPIDVQIATQEPAGVSVKGFVSSAQRKQELLAVLQGIPHVTVELQSEEEIDSQPLAARTRAESKIIAPPSPIEKQLLRYFGEPAAVEDFSKHAVTAVEALMAHAWALHHLSERYPGLDSGGELRLSPSSRQLLEAIVHDHRRAMLERTNELTELLRPVLLSITDAPPESVSEVSLFVNAQTAERLTLQLVSGSGSVGSSDDVQRDAGDLLIALHSLQIELEKER